MTSISFDVISTPAPQGGSRAVNTKQGVRLISTGGVKLKDWRGDVTAAARTAAQNLDAPLDGTLDLTVEFRFPMPKSRPKKVRAVGWAWKTTAPDLDKLLRSTGDALKVAGLIVDDARICLITAGKIETVGWTGATITVTNSEAV